MSALVRHSLLVLGVFAGVAACGSEQEFTVDVSGEYSVALTNGANGCAFENWVEGNEANSVGLTIAQEGNDLSATVDPVTAIVLALFLGSANSDGTRFVGTAKRNDFSLVAYGTIPRREGNCSYTVNATIEGTLSGDAIAGTISYSPATNDNPDCAAIECANVQQFSGSRPP